MVKERGQEIKLTVSEGPHAFNPPSEHYTTPCTKGTSWMLVGYSVRDSAKLKVDAIDLLEDLGFEWARTALKEEETQAASGVAPRLAMMKAEVKPHVKKEHRRARLRGRDQTWRPETRFASTWTRYTSSSCSFQRIRERIHLKAAKPSEGGDATVDYERLLEELEGIWMLSTRFLGASAAVLQRWTQAIEKEVASLFNSGTLVRSPTKRARQMEQNGELKIVPAKCVFTLKPPADAGGKCRRKCRMVNCGNFINKDDVDGQMRGHGSRLSRMSPIFAGRVASRHAEICFSPSQDHQGLR